jgi:hypothetical protein
VIEVIELAVPLMDRLFGISETVPNVIELLVQEHSSGVRRLNLLTKRFGSVAQRGVLEGQGSTNERVTLVHGAVERGATVHDR